MSAEPREPIVLIAVRPIAKGKSQRVQRPAHLTVRGGDAVEVLHVGRFADFRRRGVVEFITLRGSVQVRYTEETRQERK